MTNPGFRASRPAIDRFTIALVGTIDEETAMRCERETRMQLSLVQESSLHVLWDLSAVQGYSFEARVVIVRLQRFLTKKADRTVYLASEPTPRSLALWAARMGNDARACIAADHESAEAWLSGRGEPNTLVRPIANVRTAVAGKTSAAN
ncbi:MAG TPA: hypothetical protein VHZ95_04945 [Polyangiales bacterium]|jgi:hypothetical protein|nr:hypothetical protein [Polyangiales bacterium]